MKYILLLRIALASTFEKLPCVLLGTGRGVSTVTSRAVP